jgi:hypothetical protein
MKPKQEELDGIIEGIWKKVLQQDSAFFGEYDPEQEEMTRTLFVVAGDHGMTQARNKFYFRKRSSCFFFNFG